MGGVEAFFAISAFFLVRKQWGNNELSIPVQFKHRITRLYPPYVAVLIVAAGYALLMKAIPYDLVTHLFSAQNFQWMITGYKSAMQPLTAHTWTLSIEVWGGLIWLCLLRVLTKRQFKVAMYIMLAVGILYRVLTIAVGADVWVVSLCPVAHFDAFACGSLLAIGVREEKISKKIGFFILIGITGIISCVIVIANNSQATLLEGYKLLSSSKNYLNNWFTGNIYLFLSLLTIGIVGLLYLHDEQKKEIEHGALIKALILLGNDSYTFYLFHWPVLVVCKKAISIWWIVVPIVFIATLLAVIVFNKVYSTIQGKMLGGK